MLGRGAVDHQALRVLRVSAPRPSILPIPCHAEGQEFDAPPRSSYRMSMPSRHFLLSAGFALGILVLPRVGHAQAAPTPTDSLIRVQLEVVPLPVRPGAQWTLAQTQVYIVPVSSLNCPMPVASGEKSMDTGTVTGLTPGAPAVPMPGARARAGSYCTNPLRPRPAVPRTP